jgi:hypothetical protein
MVYLMIGTTETYRAVIDFFQGKLVHIIIHS